jgi:carbon monoxide dehydrogenase subunit G
MDLTGIQRIEAPREAIWASLNDPVLSENPIRPGFAS